MQVMMEVQLVFARLAIGEKGSLLKVTEDNKLFYETLDEITKVYYVSTDGVDVPKTEETKQHHGKQ